MILRGHFWTLLRTMHFYLFPKWDGVAFSSSALFACPSYLNPALFGCPRFLALQRQDPGSRDTQKELNLGSGDTQKELDIRSGDT